MPGTDEIQPGTDDIQPEMAEIQPETAEIQPEVAEIQPEMAEIQPEVAELSSAQETDDDDVQQLSAAELLEADSDAEPIRTLTIARLLARQGYYDRSLSIYDQLIAENAEDRELSAEAESVRALQSGEPNKASC